MAARRETPKPQAPTSGEAIEIPLRSALDSFLDQPTRLREKETHMTTVLAKPATPTNVCEESGYKPELKRTLSSFQMFAISFASVSVVIGVFATYGQVLQNSGPVGIWLFPVVAVGQILVALVFAQFAARIPLSGSSYQWASRLANPKIGWIF